MSETRAHQQQPTTSEAIITWKQMENEHKYLEYVTDKFFFVDNDGWNKWQSLFVIFRFFTSCHADKVHESTQVLEGGINSVADQIKFTWCHIAPIVQIVNVEEKAKMVFPNFRHDTSKSKGEKYSHSNQSTSYQVQPMILSAVGHC